MKSLRKLLYIIPLTGMMVTSCMDVENIEIDHIGGDVTMKKKGGGGGGPRPYV